VAFRDLFVAIVLPITVLFGFRIGLSSLPAALATTLALGVPGAGLVVLWRRRSPYALWAAFWLALQLHGLIWAEIPDLGAPVQFTYAVALDRALGFGTLPTVALQSLRPPDGAAVDLLAFVVYSTFFTLPFLVFFGMWRVERAMAAIYVRATVVVFFAALAVMTPLPTAPPWMASDAGVMPRIARVSTVVITEQLHRAASDAYGVNLVAAMPSLHAAMTAVIALTLGRWQSRLRRVAWLYPVAMGLALVYMGEHYLIDVLAGFLLAYCGWRVALSTSGPFAWHRAP
jgi:membrane-associated phospholipid phosphatase